MLGSPINLPNQGFDLKSNAYGLDHGRGAVRSDNTGPIDINIRDRSRKTGSFIVHTEHFYIVFLFALLCIYLTNGKTQ